MSRALTERERDVLLAMITYARPFAEQRTRVTHRQRLAWRDQARLVRVESMCSCGACPTVDFQINTSPKASQITLSAFHGEEGLLLFIDGGRLSCLELFSHNEESVRTFPPPHELQF